MRLFTPTILWMLLGKGSADKPDIIFILADDLGEKVKFSGDNVKWSFSPGVNDVGWNNPSSPTSHLDSLAEEGVILDSAYTLPICSPSRAALLTGTVQFSAGVDISFMLFIVVMITNSN